jgi:hypothetical protein
MKKWHVDLPIGGVNVQMMDLVDKIQRGWCLGIFLMQFKLNIEGLISVGRMTKLP